MGLQGGGGYAKNCGMKKLILIGALAVGFSGMVFAAGTFLVVPGDGATPADAERVCAYIQEHTGLAAVMADSADDVDGKWIVLERVEGNPLGSVDAAAGRSVLNVRWLEQDDAAAEQIERRIGQSTLRHIAVLLEVPPCVFPLCVLSVDCTGVHCLDEISGNYCPPCRERIFTVATGHGLKCQEKEIVTE